MAFINRALTALKRIFIVIGIAVAFSVGLLGAIILSLHSAQTTVPNIVGKDRAQAENEISSARLNFRVRATRPVSDAKPNTVLIQIPSAGAEVKVGQTVAVDISRSANEGESPTASPANANTATETRSENSNTNAATNSNDNKPKKKPKNANDNSNTNANRANRNRNSNVNRATQDSNANRATTPSHNLNSNGAENRNTNRGNVNRRPPRTEPTP